MPSHATWHSRGRTPPSPSRQISSSAAAIFPLSGERPPSFAIPKLELTQSSPSRTGAAGPSPHADDHRSHRRPTASVSPISTLLARRLPGTPPVLAGNTLLPASPNRAAVERATARADRARAVFPAGPSRQAAASRLFQLTARSRPPRLVGCSLGPVLAQ
jgi:hypothetical protein